MHDVLQMTEEMVTEIVQNVCGSLQTVYHTQSGEEYNVNWAKPWNRIESRFTAIGQKNAKLTARSDPGVGGGLWREISPC